MENVAIHCCNTLLLSSDRCRDVFKHPPIVAYRRTSNLRDILVKAQLPAITAPNSTNLPPGSFRCGQDCATCPYITNGLKHYTFSSTGETRNITSHIMRRSTRNFNILPPPPPGKPRAFELLKIGSFKFPPPRDKMVFKCPTLLSDLSVKCPS